ncbi:Cytochrome P450 [Macleaya cordata]|uniref:Cytochrome P450 n=1 Tax=Macleaya cordata TaxID=56857 RepID=A0A200Q657_MACCD|nr:Cytochrome P450 [Macleaya cordata]
MASFSSFSSNDHLFYAATAIFVSTLLFLAARKTKSKQLNLPPGPPGWPVVGNLFQFSQSGKQFYEYVRDLLPKYGPIFTLKMGTRTLIIITTPDLAHEALVEKGLVFASRPPENPTRSIFSCNQFSVNSAFYGPVWRSLRRNMVQEMLSTTRLKGFYGVRVVAMDRLMDRFRAEAELNHGLVSVIRNVRFVVFCILVSLCFGVEVDDKETIERIDHIMKTVLITVSPRLDHFLPILGPFYSKQRKRVEEVREEQIKTLVPFIENRRLAIQNPESDKTEAKFSYLDTLFDLKIEGRETGMTQEELVTLCSEFLNGGTDTTATAVEWGIARLIQYPEIQSKLYSEIKSTVGDRKVDEKDIPKLEYLNAFTKELLRKHPPTYFTLTHAVSEPMKLGGYDIPTYANVEFFLPSIAGDPKNWSDPDVFNPDRFLSGKEDADLTGARGVKMMPFGVGRRICPGLGMGMLHVNLMLARMVQAFEWSLPSTQRTVDFSGKLEFTVVMKNPLQAVIKPRI